MVRVRRASRSPRRSARASREIDSISRVQGRIDTAAAADALLGPYLFNYIPVADYAEVRERLTPAGIAAQVAADKTMLAAPFDVSLARVVSDDPLGLRRIAARHLASAQGEALPDLAGGYLTARDDGALLLIAHPTGSPFDGAFASRLLAEVGDAVVVARRAAADAPVRVALTGSYLFAQEDAATMKADIQRYIVLSLLGVLAVFWIGYGNLRVLPFVAYPLAVSTLLAFALSLLVYAQLNALSLSFAAILYGLSIDSGIHFYSRLLEARRRHQNDARGAIADTIGSLGWANVASSGTTAAAFLVIALSCLTVVQQLGVLTCAGMLITIAEFFVLYPALGFLLLRRGGRVAGRRRDTPRLGAWAAGAQRRAPPGAWRRAAADRDSAPLAATRVALDPSLQRLRPADSPALRVQEEIAARFTRPDRGGAVLVGARRHRGGAGRRRSGGGAAARLPRRGPAAQRPDRRRPAAVGGGATRAAGGIQRAAARRGADDTRRRPARAGLQAGALRRLHHRLRRAAQRGRHSRRRRRWRRSPPPSSGTCASVPAAPWSPPTPSRPPTAAGRRSPAGCAPICPIDPSRWRRGRCSRSTCTTCCGASCSPSSAWRCSPTCCCWWWCCATCATPSPSSPRCCWWCSPCSRSWAPTGMAVDPVNLVVTPLLLGIGVDNGVYVVSATREIGDVGAAVRLCGRAICLTSGTTIAGFGFLALSTYPPLAALGALMALGLTLALAATIFVLPALIAPQRGTEAHRG